VRAVWDKVEFATDSVLIANSARTARRGSAIQSIAKVLGMKERGGGKGIQPRHEEAVDSRTAAAFLHLHHKTLERKARMGQIPAMKLGKEWQFLRSLLSEWRKEQMNSNLKRSPNNSNEQKENRPL
jgi:excisionase family DNA binding protein